MQQLFRGKRKDFGQWAEGSLTVEYDGRCHIHVWTNELVEPENNLWDMVDEFYEVIPETIGRFINMVDKSEKKIFEGDIVNCYDNSAKDNDWGLDKMHVGVVTETPPCYSLKIPGKLIYDTPAVKQWKDDIYLDKWCNAENIEVIGNIHDNPELLNPASGTAGDNYMLDPNLQAATAEGQEVAATESAAQDNAMEATQDAEEGSTEG